MEPRGSAAPTSYKGLREWQDKAEVFRLQQEWILTERSLAKDASTITTGSVPDFSLKKIGSFELGTSQLCSHVDLPRTESLGSSLCPIAVC